MVAGLRLQSGGFLKLESGGRIGVNPGSGVIIPGVTGVSSGGITGSGAFTVALPGASTGYLAFAHHFGAQAELTAPTGWTLDSQGGFHSGDLPYSRWGVWVGAGTPGTSWNHGNATEGASVAILGFDAAITVTDKSGTDSTASIQACPALSLADGARIVRLLFLETFNSTPSVGYPASHPDGQVVKTQTPVIDHFTVAAATVAQGSGGSTGTALFTNSGSTYYASRSMTLALNG